MLTSNIIHRARSLYIRSSTNQHGHTGLSSSRQIGQGMDFDQLRDYHIGDNVRAIDWKSSARTQKLVVRTFYEDQHQSIIILVDSSCSTQFGSGEILKSSAILDISLLLFCAIMRTHDNFSALFFDQTTQTFPFGTGKKHALLLAQALSQRLQNENRTLTDFSLGIQTCIKTFRKKSFVILLSDFIGDISSSILTELKKQHETVALIIEDPLESSLPEQLLIELEDSETGQLFDGKDPFQMYQYQSLLKTWKLEQESKFKKIGIPYCKINIKNSYDTQLIHFFQQYGQQHSAKRVR